MTLQRTFQVLEIPLLCAVPLVFALCAIFQLELTVLLTLLVLAVVLACFFAGFEARKPQLSEIMPCVVLSALAIAGRLLFIAVPNVQPVTAICIIAGIAFGKRCGFMTGALTALISSIFLGIGPWTAIQMYAWGLIGYIAGTCAFCFRKASAEKSPNQKQFFQTIVLIVFGVLASFFFGLFNDTWMILSFVRPLTWPSALAVYAVGIPINVAHAAGTAAFLLVLFVPWMHKLERIKCKYANVVSG